MLHLSSLDFYGAALQTGARVARLVAANVANSDTPNYKARGIDFDQALAARINGDAPASAQYVRGLPTGLDGNDVSLSYESLQSVENSQRIRASLAFVSHDVASLITALQPQGPSNAG
ncbi:MAG TPA: hypothetical protein VF292_15875 [Rhodanobacteraceae bacterium]